MKTSKNGIKLISQWEGTRLTAYKDVAGVWTIGVGHTSAAGSPTVTPGMTITQSQSDRILASDLKKVEDSVNRLVKVKLNQNQFDALVSFQYNTGKLSTSSGLKYLNQGDYSKAADAFTLYNKARVNGKLKVIDGLVNRRSAEHKLFMTPSSSATPASAGVVIAGSTVAATTPEHLWAYVAAGTLATAVIVYVAISIYEFRKYRRMLNVK